MITYFEWNKALTEYFFKEKYKNNNVFLCITCEDLDKIGLENFDIGNGHLDYLNTITKRTTFINSKNDIINKTKLLNQLGNNINNEDFLKLQNNREEYPPYLGFLVFFCLAEMEILKEKSVHAYYDKIFILLRRVIEDDLSTYFPLNGSSQSSKMSELRGIWKSLEEWSLSQNKGRFKEYKSKSGYQKHACKARINALLSFSDRIKIYKYLSQEYFDEYLPSILDIAPIVQKYVPKHSHVFSANEIYNEKNDSNKFLRDAIYNICISDLKSELIESTKKLKEGKLEKLIGVFHIKYFPEKSKISHILPDNQKVNKKALKDISSKWLSGGKISFENNDYEIIKGNIKKFTKTQKSLEFPDHPYIQVNRIIEDNENYIFGVYKRHNAFKNFENWVEKHDDYEHIKVDNFFGLDWRFYKVNKPKYNLPEYGIVIDRNQQQEFHLDNPKISLQGGLKIKSNTFLGGFEPKVVIENFNYYKKNDQYEVSIIQKNYENIESKIESFSINMFEGFCELKFQYPDNENPYVIAVKLDIIDEDGDGEIIERTIHEEIIIKPSFMNQSLWKDNFGFTAYNFLSNSKSIRLDEKDSNLNNSFNNPCLELNNESFRKIEGLLFKKRLLLRGHSSTSLKQLSYLLNLIFEQHELADVEYENSYHEIKLIHMMQIFSFIFKRFQFEKGIKGDKELINEIIYSLDSKWAGSLSDSVETVEDLLYDKSTLYAPFVLWSILGNKILGFKNYSLSVGDVYREFLSRAYDEFEEGNFPEISKLWNYNQIIIKMFFVYNHKKGIKNQKFIEELMDSWSNNGMDLNTRKNIPLKLHYLRLKDYCKQNLYSLKRTFEKFETILVDNSINFYSFEKILEIELIDDKKEEIKSKKHYLLVNKNNDLLLQSLCLFIQEKRNRKLEVKKFADFFTLINPDSYITKGKIFEYRKNLRILGHTYERKNRIYALPPYLNLIQYDNEKNVGKYLLSGSRDSFTIEELRKRGEQYKIKIQVDAQFDILNPNRVLIDIPDKALENYINDINYQFGKKFISLNENKNIYDSILNSYDLDGKFRLCKIIQPDADYITKLYHDPESKRFKNKILKNRFNLIKYTVEVYGANISKFFIHDSEKQYFHQMKNYSHGLLHFFKLINESFIYYDKEQELLFIPVNYSFPIDIEKALIIKSGLLPKPAVMDGYSNFFASNKKEMKFYQNISSDDLILLEETLNQKTKFLIEK